MGYIFDALKQPDEGARETGHASQQGYTAPQPGGAPTASRPADSEPAEPDYPVPHAVPLARVDDRIVSVTDPTSVASEEYRAIRTSVLARWQHRRHLIHTITSATPQEGKTITSLNLGLSFAELRNRRVLLIEADLRLPRFASMLGLPPTRGLVGLLENRADMPEVVQPFVSSGLDVISAGGRASSQTIQLISSARMVTLLKEARERYDHVIIDTPPVVEFADAGVIGALSDDVLMVVRMNQTPQPVVEHAIRALNSYNAPVAGLIATDQVRTQRRYYYKYDYRQKSGLGPYRLIHTRAKAA